jgi:hypothetical protein
VPSALINPVAMLMLPALLIRVVPSGALLRSQALKADVWWSFVGWPSPVFIMLGGGKVQKALASLMTAIASAARDLAAVMRCVVPW